MVTKIEENEKQVNESNVPVGNNSVLNAFKQEFSTALYSIYINSLKRDVAFKDVSVNEQKTLSKIMLQNEDRKDITYDAQCALINKLCLEPGFDVYELTEFDRIRILMEIYKSNYYKKTITYKCEHCGCENAYALDFQKYIDRMNAFTLNDITYTVEDDYRVYNFTLNYPKVRTVSNFYKTYMKKYDNTTTKEKEMLDNIGTVEYVNLFINKIELTNKNDPSNKKVADFSMMSYNDVEELLSLFPQSVIFSEKEGVLKYIATEFLEKINTVFTYEKCSQCGAATNEGIGSIQDFF